MIIAFDGNVYTGKTSLIMALSRKMDANIVNEYSSYYDENKQERKGWDDYLKIQRRYLILDQERKLTLSSHKTNLLDRSFISLFAHVWALYTLGIDIRREVLKGFVPLLKKEKIIIPTAYINVCCPWTIARKRFLQNKKYGAVKGTADYLIGKNYFSSVCTFNNRILRLLPSFQVNTKNSLSKNIKEVMHFLNSLSESNLTKGELLPRLSSVLLMKK